MWPYSTATSRIAASVARHLLIDVALSRPSATLAQRKRSTSSTVISSSPRAPNAGRMCSSSCQRRAASPPGSARRLYARPPAAAPRTTPTRTRGGSASRAAPPARGTALRAARSRGARRRGCSQLLLGAAAIPAVSRAPERDVVAAPVGVEPGGVDNAALAPPGEQLSYRSRCHLPPPVAYGNRIGRGSVCGGVARAPELLSPAPGPGALKRGTERGERVRRRR